MEISMERINQATENAIIKMIQNGDAWKIDYNSKVDVGPIFKQIYAKIDYTSIYDKIKTGLEEEIARKVVDKIVTEMGTDIKNLMSKESIREDFKYMLRQGVESILAKVRE